MRVLLPGACCHEPRGIIGTPAGVPLTSSGTATPSRPRPWASCRCETHRINVTLERMAAASLAVDSYALSSLLSDALTSTCDVAGLLLGDTRVQRSACVTDDTDRPVEVETRCAVLRSHLCSTAVQAFFDAAGCVDEDALATLLSAADGPLLGWFIFRRASSLTPSARETEVWRQLSRRATRLGTPQPFFGLVCSDQPADGEPFTAQYVFLAPSEPHPTPLPVSVVNVGSVAPRRLPEAPAPSFGWHPLLNGPAGSDDAAAPWRALEVAAALGAEQTRNAVEAALERATALCLEVERADDALQASRERVRRIAAEHDELDAPVSLSDDESLAAEATKMPHPAAYEPPPVPLSDAEAAPLSAPLSILDEILAGEHAANAALQH